MGRHNGAPWQRYRARAYARGWLDAAMLAMVLVDLWWLLTR